MDNMSITAEMAEHPHEFVLVLFIDGSELAMITVTSPLELAALEYQANAYLAQITQYFGCLPGDMLMKKIAEEVQRRCIH